MAMLDVTVTVYERDAERISYIGSKSCGKATEEERKEFDQFIRFYGSMVCHKVVDNK